MIDDVATRGRGRGRVVANVRRRHPVLGVGVVAMVAAFVAIGVVSQMPLAVPYGVLVLAGTVFVAWTEPPGGWSALTLVGLSLWAAGHMAGGTIDIGAGRTFYNGVIAGIHVDNIVHFIGFGTGALAWSEASAVLREPPWHGRLRPGPVALAVWLVGMGIGALNEVVEFGLTLVLDETNVGGYANTGRDLVANLLGAAVAATIAARRQAEAS